MFFLLLKSKGNFHYQRVSAMSGALSDCDMMDMHSLGVCSCGGRMCRIRCILEKSLIDAWRHQIGEFPSLKHRWSFFLHTTQIITPSS